MSELPHPVTGKLFDSPVPPGAGWPGDVADPATPIARDGAAVAAAATSVSGWRELDAQISVCRACPRLVSWREQVAHVKRRSFADEPYWGRPVPGFGDERAPIVIVGLAPAANGANRTGRVFTGDRSGDWLFAALYRTGLATRQHSTSAADGQRLIHARMAASVRCAPPENKPTVTERDTCAPWLDAEFALMAPSVRVLVALGSFGWDAALRMVRRSGGSVPRPKPRFGHGAVAKLGQSDQTPLWLIGCFHPSQQNTFTGRLTEQMTDAVLNRARDLAGLPPYGEGSAPRVEA